MSAVAFNVLWIVCVLLLLLALFLAVRRRRIASRQMAQARQQTQAYRQEIHGTNAPDVHIYMPSYQEYLSAQRQYGQPAATTGNVEMGSVQPPPPVYKAEDQPPPSYQDYSKDVRIQAAASSSAN